MRSILLLIMVLFFGVACAGRSQGCRQELGEDRSPPREVVSRVQNELKDYRLIDKKDCPDEVYWLAISPDQPIDRPRVVGSDRLVVMDKKTKKITIVVGQ